MKLNKEIIFVLFFIITKPTSVFSQDTWQSDLVNIDDDGNLTYFVDPTSGIKLPDFSSAGYKSGNEEIPDVPVKLTIDPIDGDNTAHIQAAIDQVGQIEADENGIRGAVLLNPGQYDVHGIIRLKYSGVILRGSGDKEDVTENTILYGVGNDPSGRPVIHIGGGQNTVFSTEIANTRSNIVDDTVKVGQKHFQVEDASKYKIGDEIIIYHPCTAEWIESVDYGGTAGDAPWVVDEQPIIYHTTITAINCNTIYTNSPVFNDLVRSLSQSYIYVHDNTGFIENAGLEDLRIDIEYDTSDPDDKDHASSAVKCTQLQDSWIKNCEFIHFYYAGVDIYSSRNLTISDCEANDPIGPSSGGYKYNYCTNTATQNVLFTNCIARKGRHNFVSNGTSSVAGIVFYNCTSIDPLTASEGHRRWTTGMLFDNFRDYGENPGRVLGLFNRGNWGTGHGWSSANSVAWNCDVTREGADDGQIVIQKPPTGQNFAIGCKGIVDNLGPFSNPEGYIEGTNNEAQLIPSSLYEAQLNSRLKKLNDDVLVTIDEQNSCEGFTWIDGNTYYESTNEPTFTLQNIHGCDSVVQLNLTITNTVAVRKVSVNGNVLTANNPNATYVWVDCDNDYSIIEGETDQSFVVTEKGNYAVMLTEEGCTVISDCINMTTVGIIDNQLGVQVKVFPNPIAQNFKVDLGKQFNQARIELRNVNGRLVFSNEYNHQQILDIEVDQPKGVYFLTIYGDGKKASIRIVKN
ncbi:T9SS type A sorting domain-containing protein [Flammeovirga agarivorans]|uniref:T9SS type A sorting domain-containing protein n=1 Tax=Flammeovirga agarivorans TaxID=2726742 RepID=A0A7X8SNK1_9BACT|nr:T9SS type A sorting domain-containing protein [Flammeovirga agarivorans]NLR93509.1 T9SS type A sorting domain-containing protein [Flammeovirga agarivorans]